MGQIRASRVLGGAMALLTAASGLVVGLGVQQASAAAPKQTFSVNTGFQRTVPVRTGGHGVAYRPVNVSVDTYGPDLFGVKIAVDGSKAKGIVELDLPAGCSYTDTAHLHELCNLGDLPAGHGELSLGVRAAVGAQAGRTADVLFKVTATNGVERTDAGQQSDISTVLVGDGPDLAINDLGRSIKAPAGKTTSVPLRVTNLGSTSAKGVIVFIRDQYQHAELPGNFSNCVYEVYAGAQRAAQCTFPDAVVQPGETYALSTPFSLDAPAGAQGDQIQYGAGLLHDDWIGAPTGTKGTGPELTLVKVATQPNRMAAPDPSLDIDQYNNLYYTNLDTGIIADLAGIGGTFSGTVGTVGKATIGLRNSGNTTFSKLFPSGDGHSKETASVWVAFPSQVAVTAVPHGCTAVGGGPEGGTWSGGGDPHAYVCLTTAVLKPGGQVTFTFGIKPLQLLKQAYAGIVSLGPEDVTANQANNLAKLYINAVKAGTKPSTAPSASASAGTVGATATASASTVTGGLASTGGGSDATPIALTGAAAIALGAGAVVAVRRRRAGSHS